MIIIKTLYLWLINWQTEIGKHGGVFKIHVSFAAKNAVLVPVLQISIWTAHVHTVLSLVTNALENKTHLKRQKVFKVKCCHSCLSVSNWQQLFLFYAVSFSRQARPFSLYAGLHNKFLAMFFLVPCQHSNTTPGDAPFQGKQEVCRKLLIHTHFSLTGISNTAFAPYSVEQQMATSVINTAVTTGPSSPTREQPSLPQTTEHIASICYPKETEL